MDALKHEWAIFGKTGVFILAALVAVIIISIAWFASNRQVSGTGMNIQVSGSDFELAAEGTRQGQYSELLESESGVKVTLKPEGAESKPGMATDGSKTAISWAITDTSNLGNQNVAGINPGSSGKLTFYIIAQKTGSLTVTLDLSLTGYTTAQESAGKSSTLNPVGNAVQQLMEGHILLFAGYDETKNAYKGWISADAASWQMSLDESNNATLSRNENGKLIWTATVQKDTAYPVTIYWIWPEVLGEYLMKDQEHIGPRRPVLFQKDQDSNDTTNSDPEVLPSGLFEKMCAEGVEEPVISPSAAPEGTTGSSGTPEKLYINRYFKWTSAQGKSCPVKQDKLEQMRNGPFHTQIYGNLCSYYNAADQYLGENVRYVKLTLEVQ